MLFFFVSGALGCAMNTYVCDAVIYKMYCTMPDIIQNNNEEIMIWGSCEFFFCANKRALRSYIPRCILLERCCSNKLSYFFAQCICVQFMRSNSQNGCTSLRGFNVALRSKSFSITITLH